MDISKASTSSSSTPAESAKVKVAFISGPLEHSKDYFTTHYAPRILEAIKAEHTFIVGPSRGVDFAALRFLIQQGVSPTRITVYVAQFEKQDKVRWFVDKGGRVKVVGKTHTERDAAMTADSDYDILRYMTEEEQKVLDGDRYYPGRISGTEKNERRRLGIVDEVLKVTHAQTGPGKKAPFKK